MARAPASGNSRSQKARSPARKTGSSTGRPKPVSAKPASKEPTSKKPASKKLASKEPARKKPVAIQATGANGGERRSQAQRREQTYQRVLDSAVRLFGARGYANTSLEEIASDCGLTTRPVYHYFGNKEALFAAVNEAMEARIIATLDTVPGLEGSAVLLARWEAFLSLCEEAAFRQVVLIDSPLVLGRARWASSAVTRHTSDLFDRGARGKRNVLRERLLAGMLMAAFSEAALLVATSDDVTQARREATDLVSRMLSSL